MAMRSKVDRGGPTCAQIIISPPARTPRGAAWKMAAKKGGFLQEIKKTSRSIVYEAGEIPYNKYTRRFRFCTICLPIEPN
jgi:hypothetical protein